MNFCLPINLDRLQNDRLKLIPIENCTDENLEEYITETCINHPELWEFFPSGPYESVASYKKYYDDNHRHNPITTIFAIYLKAGQVSKRKPGSTEIETIEVAEGTFAGTTGLLNASPENSTVEIGYVMLLPQFHRTLVNTHASCLLLKHLLDPIEGGDLNLRRVQWQANSMNQPSIAAAQRLGMTLEGVARWQRVVADNKKCASEASGERADGKPVVDRGGSKLGPGRHSAVLAMCWDDWLDGKREHVMSLLQREAKG